MGKKKVVKTQGEEMLTCPVCGRIFKQLFQTTKGLQCDDCRNGRVICAICGQPIEDACLLSSMPNPGPYHADATRNCARIAMGNFDVIKDRVLGITWLKHEWIVESYSHNEDCTVWWFTITRNVGEAMFGAYNTKTNTYSFNNKYCCYCEQEIEGESYYDPALPAPGPYHEACYEKIHIELNPPKQIRKGGLDKFLKVKKNEQ